MPQPDELKDPALVAAVELARAAAQEEAGDEEIGAHVGSQIEGAAAVTHLFEAAKRGYRGWSWAATVASAGPDTIVTVSEVVLLPGPEALVAPDWIPWDQRIQAGDLGVGDLLPTAPDDPRLVPAYVASDDPAVEEVATELGLGRVRVLARPGREEAAARWFHSDFGPSSDMARGAPARCGTCGFYLMLAGSLGASFGTCGNELSPADAHVVHAEYGCGAHSEAEVEQVSPVLVANLIYDDARLDVEPLVPAQPTPEPAPEAATADPTTESAPAAEPSAEATPEAVATDTAPEATAADSAPASSTAEQEAAPEPEHSAEPDTADAAPASPAVEQHASETDPAADTKFTAETEQADQDTPPSQSPPG
ncbi:hypothetical protein GCM10027436_70520 [Actinophytocola sediminis]